MLSFGRRSRELSYADRSGYPAVMAAVTKVQVTAKTAGDPHGRRDADARGGEGLTAHGYRVLPSSGVLLWKWAIATHTGWARRG